MPELPSEKPPPGHLSVEHSEALARRRRGRNIAMLIVLIALSLLFYAISIVKMAK
jgi:hypothetical protein